MNIYKRTERKKGVVSHTQDKRTGAQADRQTAWTVFSPSLSLASSLLQDGLLLVKTAGEFYVEYAHQTCVLTVAVLLNNC